MIIVIIESVIINIAAGRQINVSEIKAHKAKTTVEVYIKFIHANSFNALEAFEILSITFPE